MKFLSIINNKKTCYNKITDKTHSYNKIYSKYSKNLYSYINFTKNEKKIWNKVKKGISKNKKKNSIIRDVNTNSVGLYLNLSCKKGLKNLFFKNYNISLENLYYLLNNQNHKIDKKENIDFNIDLNFLNFLSDYNNFIDKIYFNEIMDYEIESYSSMFEIKAFKNNKSLKKLKGKKYSHEIVYIPKQRRIKYVLRALKLYENSFKNYNVWERVFWSIFNILKNKNNFLKKRRDYIYSKSIKFFKKSK